MKAGQKTCTTAAMLILCRVLENTKDESALDWNSLTENVATLASLPSTLVRWRLQQNILN